jgi:hypothetical protein
MPRWLEAMLAVLGGLAALIAIVQFGIQQLTVRPKPVAAPPVAVQAPSGSGLDVIDASLQTAERRSHVLGLIPSGADHFLTLDVTIANRTNKARSACTLIVDYGIDGGGHGTAVAFVGAWSDWYDSDPKSSFDLPAAPSTAQRFFIAPESKAIRLAWARARTRCEGPENEVSRWTNVDLSHAEWPKA